MIADFERRLADVLGTHLPSPALGAVDVAPGRAQSQVLVSVTHVEPLAEVLHTVRREVVGGSPERRRVLRLRCEVRLEFRSLQNQTRSDVLEACEAALYLVDAPEFRQANELAGGGATDPGFQIQQLWIKQADLPGTILLTAEGLFWPVGVTGEAGVAIDEARIRQTLQPLALLPEKPRLVANGATVDLTLRAGAVGTAGVRSDGVTQRPFGTLVVRLVDAGGRPGAGQLSGGVDGPAGARVLDFNNREAQVRYTPPAAPAADVLVVSLATAEDGTGIEIGRFSLPVRGA
jgi:hypothetical protein